MKSGLLCAFLGGAIVGAGAALLFAPEKGEDLRGKIKKCLCKKGMCCCDNEVDDMIDDVSDKAKDLLK